MQNVNTKIHHRKLNWPKTVLEMCPRTDNVCPIHCESAMLYVVTILYEKHLYSYWITRIHYSESSFKSRLKPVGKACPSLLFRAGLKMTDLLTTGEQIGKLIYINYLLYQVLAKLFRKKWNASWWGSSPPVNAAHALVLCIPIR